MSFTQLLQSPTFNSKIIGKNTAMLDNFFGGEDFNSLICETKTVTSPSNDSVNSFSSQEEQIDDVAKFSLFSDDFLSPTTMKQEFGEVSNAQIPQNISFTPVQKPLVNNVNTPVPVPPSLMNFPTTPTASNLPNFPVNHSSQQNFNIQQTFLLDSMLKNFTVPATNIDPKLANATSPMVNPYAAAALLGMMPQLALSNPLFPLMQQPFVQNFPMASPMPSSLPTAAKPTPSAQTTSAPATTPAVETPKAATAPVTASTQPAKQDETAMEDEVSKLKKQYKKTKIEKKMDEMIGAGASNALANVKAHVASKTTAALSTKEPSVTSLEGQTATSPTTSISSESSSSPTMSPQPAPTSSNKKTHKRSRSSDEDKDQQFDDDVELQGLDESAVKLQRRRIKNRESAQASRERKKLYVQGLEKKVQDLTSKNAEIQKTVSNLESENAKLKARIKELETGEICGENDDEPSMKKRRVSFSNPFALSFWNYLMSSFAGSNATVGDVAAPAIGIVDTQQAQQSAPQNSFEPFYQTTSKKVVLFIMLFCVAIMVAYPHDKILEAFNQATSPVVASSATESKEAEYTHVRVGGRKLLKTKEGKEQLADQVRSSFNQFNHELSAFYDKFDFSNEANMTDMVKQSLSDESQDQLVFQANFDATKQQIVISLKDDKVINLEDEDEEMEAAKKKSDSSRGRFDSQVISISKSLFKSICDALQ